LTGLGSEVVAFTTYPDHHAYNREDVNRLRRWAGRQPPDAVVVTTQKDLVKLRLTHLGDRPLWAVRIALRPTVGQDVLDRKLRGVLGGE
jgi:tetraacyldisaccharide 4'-kinase